MTGGLEGAFGLAFLRHLLALPEQTTVDDHRLSGTQREALGILHSCLAAPDRLGMNAFMNVVGGLFTYVPELGMSRAMHLRASAGAVKVSPSESGDPLVDALASVAADVWPLYLLRPQMDFPPTFMMASGAATFGHPGMAAAGRAFYADGTLMQLFPFAGEGESVSSSPRRYSNIHSVGHNGTLEIGTLLPNLIAVSAFRVLMTGTELGLDSLVRELKLVVNDLRRFADGDEVMVPVVVGLAGPRLTSSALPLDSGHLRPTTDQDRALFFPNTSAPDAVWETSMPTKMLSLAPNVFDGGGADRITADFRRAIPVIRRSHRDFQRALDLARLSLLLAAPPGATWLTLEVGRYAGNFIAPGGVRYLGAASSELPTFELTPDSFAEVQSWHSCVTARHHASLDIGVRRLLSATVRTDPADAFVDAVICWESLFGTSQETNFRVPGSIAMLLEPTDAAMRSVLYRDLQGIYGKRSRLVHGGVEPDTEALEILRQRSIEVAAECLRRLYGARFDLVAHSSESRATSLMLG